ncbi:MAG: metallophosphoesterase [Clostridiales bacterium]|nr:metallophosphoesterase [Clostridiales bacterium]
MAFYVTGDTHADFNRIFEFFDFYETTKDDILIILGDAGINYFLDDTDYQLKKELSELQITLFCVHGNHEQRPYMISTYEEKEWHGGTVYVEPEFPNIIFAKDGEIYDFDGKKAVVIGGAYSIDKYSRIRNNAPWFETEQPDEETIRYVEAQLERWQWKVDYVFTHTIPLKYEPSDLFLDNIDQSIIDKSTEKWLDSLESRLTYYKWYCGHFHTDRDMGNIMILYQEIVDLD